MTPSAAHDSGTVSDLDLPLLRSNSEIALPLRGGEYDRVMAGEQRPRVAEIRDQLARLAEERRALLSELSDVESARSQRALSSMTEPLPETPLKKIELFRRRFVSRSDLFPVFWENRAKGTNGYFPACDAVFENGSRLKPTELYSRFGSSRFHRLDDQVLEDNLTGKRTIGTFAIRPDDTCIFLAADFDGAGWREAVTAYTESASVLGFQLLVEVSRSGDGAHAWLFFAEPIAASLARGLGTCFLVETAGHFSGINLDSYDRFFPNQDTVPKGGFGNLIGLPLQKKLREQGRTVFVDENFVAAKDQWRALAETPAYWEHQVRASLERYAEVSPIEDALPGEFDEACLNSSVGNASLGLVRISDWHAELRESLAISTVGLPDEFLAKLMKLATFPNPQFFEKQRLRFPVFNTPRFLVGYEKTKTSLALPRGLLEAASDLFASRGARLEVSDFRLSEKRIRLRFTGSLTEAQRRALKSFEGRDYGVLVAPPGAGKTVMACSIISDWKLATVVLVNRRSIAKQWRERLLEFTTLSEERVGSWGGGKAKLTGVVDIVMMQSLSGAEDVAAFFRSYSALIVDECHHVPAVSFEAIMKQCGCRKIIGLTATPQRKDRLERLLFQQCGPIRHLGESDADPNLLKRLHIVVTQFDPRGDDESFQPLHEIWEKLVEDDARNQLIAFSLAQQLQEGRRCIVLSDRLVHLDKLENLTRRCSLPDGLIFERMVGGRSEAALARQEERLREGLGAGAAACIFATGSFLGEGYDRKELDTLFLCMPISFRGRLVQYAGRLHRQHEGKKEVRVFDFLDAKLPVALSMWRRRKGAYREMGYAEVSESES